MLGNYNKMPPRLPTRTLYFASPLFDSPQPNAGQPLALSAAGTVETAAPRSLPFCHEEFAEEHQLRQRLCSHLTAASAQRKTKADYKVAAMPRQAEVTRCMRR